MKMNKLFLDTTIQIDKIFAYEREKILDYIENKETATSTYVLMEFNRRILKDCRYIHELLKEEETVGDVIRRINKLPKKWEGKKNICISILAAISDTGDLENKDRTVIRLKRFIDRQLKKQFFYGIINIVDETKCDLARESVVEKNDRYFLKTTCKQGEMKCELENFVERNKNEFEDILNGLKLEETLDERLENACNSLEEILNEHEKAMGKNCNKILGDCIISIETPKNHKILTTDHHYELICKHIDRDPLLFQ